jgi:hypothetical protein
MSKIDFAVATGLFFTVIAVVLLYLVNYMSSYTGIATTSELRTVAYDIYNSLFTGEGVPSNWEDADFTPLKVGLATMLYRLPVRITDTGGAARSNATINITISFDPACTNRTWNDTVRVYDSDNREQTFGMYNTSFCPSAGRYVNRSEIVLNVTLAANGQKTLYVYFSPDKAVLPPNYTMPFINSTNYTVIAYPEDELDVLSVEKLAKLRSLPYAEVVHTLGTDYEFSVEVVEVE